MADRERKEKNNRANRRKRNKLFIASLFFTFLLIWIASSGQLFMKREIWIGLIWSFAVPSGVSLIWMIWCAGSIEEINER